MSQDALQLARAALQRGLLGEADMALARIASDAPASERASAALLAGNIAFERGRPAEAAVLWERAAGLFELAQPGGPGAEAARGNLDLAQAQLERQVRLQEQADRLQLGVGVAVLAGACVLLLLARRAR